MVFQSSRLPVFVMTLVVVSCLLLESVSARSFPCDSATFSASGYTYTISLCAPVRPGTCARSCYVQQVDSSGACKCLGFSSPAATATPDGFTVTSGDGDPYSDGTPRQFKVGVTCSTTTSAPSFTGEQKPVYVFSWNSVCPDSSGGGSSGGISGGSIFSIVFCLSFFFYFAIGMLVKWKFYQASGCDLLPNANFWKDFPTLLKDGLVFALCCGKTPSSSYQSV